MSGKNPDRAPTLGFMLLAVALVLGCLALRPLIPVDETRYLSVAWEMWSTGDFLVPHLNGTPYSHKPPLLFWLMHLTWYLVGISEWSARLVAPAFGLSCALLGASLARRLWPDHPQAARALPFMLLAMPLWAVLGSMTMFDMLLAFMALVCALGYQEAARGNKWLGWGLVALGLAGGLLAKGPAIFVHVLPLGLLMPWWKGGGNRAGLVRWYLGLLGASAVGVGLALLWALPAASAGGQEYARAILWGQTVNRMAHSMAHARPLWWYLPLLPLVLLPWFLLPSLWRGLKHNLSDQGIRYCVAWGLPAFVIFSLISGKQVHYLLPMILPAGLIAARLAEHAFNGHRIVGGVYLAIGVGLLVIPRLGGGGWLSTMDFSGFRWYGSALLWGVGYIGAGVGLVFWRAGSVERAMQVAAVAMVGLVLSLHIGFFETMGGDYDLREVSEKIGELQAGGKPVAVWPLKYEGQFQFYGRLSGHFEEFEYHEDALEWAAANPEGYIVIVSDRAADIARGKGPVHQQRLGGQWLGLWRAGEIIPEHFVRY